MSPKTGLVERIKRSEELVGQLYPVLVDKETKEPLDGRTRRRADPNWRVEEVEITGTEEEKKLKRLAIKHHANWHRKDFNRTEALTEIAESTGWRGLKPFAEFLGVSEMTISKYLPQKYKDLNQSERAQKNGSAKLGLAGEALSNPELDNGFGEWLDKIEGEYSLWECLEARPEGFGSGEFHGNCSPDIVYAVLKRYSSPGDVVFDPMAGSGTFIDVARAMGYKEILARDIRPLREDIVFGDAEDTRLPDESVDFVFAHFPYWRLIQYSEIADDLSLLDFDGFLAKSECIMWEMQRILRHGKYFVVMIGNLRENGVVDLESLFSVMGSKFFTLWDKIVKKIRTWDPETCGQRMGLAKARARQYNYCIVNHDTILVFRKV